MALLTWRVAKTHAFGHRRAPCCECIVGETEFVLSTQVLKGGTLWKAR